MICTRFSNRLFHEENSSISQSLNDLYTPSNQKDLPLKFGTGDMQKARIDNSTKQVYVFYKVYPKIQSFCSVFLFGNVGFSVLTPKNHQLELSLHYDRTLCTKQAEFRYEGS